MSFIRRLGDPVLKCRATPVDRFDDSLRKQVSRMAGIMNDALGVGLAAPQLGISQRLLVYRVGPDAPVIALANPEIEWTSDDAGDPRRGLPLDPGHHRRRRAARSTCACAPSTRRARTALVEASGLEARVIQHEMDHLDGVLILDRTDPRPAQARAAASCRASAEQARARATAGLALRRLPGSGAALRTPAASGTPRTRRPAPRARTARVTARACPPSRTTRRRRSRTGCARARTSPARGRAPG